MKAGTETDDWRAKYFESLRSLEDEERLFRAMEATLKRLVGRLCIASLGLSPQLDEQLRNLQAAIRREATKDELEQITPPLTDAIHALDHAAPAPATVAAQPAKAPSETKTDASGESIVGDERIRALLAAILSEIKCDSELVNQVEALDARLTNAMTYDQLPDVLSALTELVGKRIQRIERAKQEAEGLLSQMVDKLDEISQFVADQQHEQTQSLASTETLNVQLFGEMKAMGESVESASDLAQIRQQVRNRLDSIGQFVKEFRQRETDRADAIRARSEQMQARVAVLEAEAKKLHSQLKDEQKLSSIDVLTQVPNRLAYEKRIEEELKRWQRFNQPTCIAAWDIDYFKRINDTYGHRAGDKVLRTVAECLAGQIRATDFLGRYGGEEFVMILAGTRLDDAMRMVDNMRINVSNLGFHFRGAPISITVSCGVTALLVDDSSGAAFDRADKALYQAKELGRNRCATL